MDEVYLGVSGENMLFSIVRSFMRGSPPNMVLRGPYNLYTESVFLIPGNSIFFGGGVLRIVITPLSKLNPTLH